MSKDTPSIDLLTETFKALSDPTRLKIVRRLVAHEGMLCVNALARGLEVSPSAVSQHLRVLKQAGLVKSERRGYYIHYYLNRDRLNETTRMLDLFLKPPE